MAHSLGLSVTGEGVETDTQWQLLAEHGCDAVQGYLISRPLSADATAEYLATRAALVSPYALPDGRLP